MKLILSRKGFDTGSGGKASPIFPDGTMFSLPIPVAADKITYGALRHFSEDLGEVNVGDVVKDLTNGRYRPDSPAHIDPHLNIRTYPEVAGSKQAKNWRGLLGQEDKAQGHLNNQGVGKGDLFLFFGLYKPVERVDQGDRKWRFTREPWRHVLWGWLQVGEKYDLNSPERDQVPSWAHYQPHMHYPNDVNNTLYVASDALELGTGPVTLPDGGVAPGWGRFPYFHNDLVLTKPQETRASKWRLPGWFDQRSLSNFEHCDWTHEDGYAYVQRNGNGQEFVLDMDKYRPATEWALQFVREHGER